MSAPGGLCGSCGRPLQWTMHEGLLWVRCRWCVDLFGTEFAEGESREGREAVMPDDRSDFDLPF